MNSDRFEGFGSGPRYAQLAKTLFDEIDSKQYSIGDLLPTEYELCAQFGVSRSTAREAVKQLVQQGLVVDNPAWGVEWSRRPRRASTHRQCLASLTCGSTQAKRICRSFRRP